MSRDLNTELLLVSEERGMLEDAVKLYDLASKHAKVVSLLNTLLAQVIALPATPESRRDR